MILNLASGSLCDGFSEITLSVILHNKHIGTIILGYPLLSILVLRPPKVWVAIKFST